MRAPKAVIEQMVECEYGYRAAGKPSRVFSIFYFLLLLFFSHDAGSTWTRGTDASPKGRDRPNGGVQVRVQLQVSPLELLLLFYFYFYLFSATTPVVHGPEEPMRPPKGMIEQTVECKYGRWSASTGAGLQVSPLEFFLSFTFDFFTFAFFSATTPVLYGPEPMRAPKGVIEQTVECEYGCGAAGQPLWVTITTPTRCGGEEGDSF
jgi:hypothetical protein